MVSLKTALGQQFIIKNLDTDSALLSVSSANINAYNKPILNVAVSQDLTSAVPLSTV